MNQLSLHMTASDSSDAENEDILDIVHPTTPSASAGLASDQSLASTGDFGTLKSANVVSDVSTTKSKSPFDASKPIWDSDEEPDTTDIFEKRSMGLIDDIKKTFSVKNAGGKLKKARREDLSDDEDDMFDATEKEISTANSVSAETFPQIDAALNSRLTTSKSRSMVIADDDDDE